MNIGFAADQEPTDLRKTVGFWNMTQAPEPMVSLQTITTIPPSFLGDAVTLGNCDECRLNSRLYSSPISHRPDHPMPSITTPSVFKTLLAISLAAALSGCGGGGGGTTTSSVTGTTTAPLTATFVDPPTKGLAYSDSPSGLTGITDASGSFAYQAGDTVSFSIPTTQGSISVGSYQPIAPQNGGSAVLSVLALPNGSQVAQTLQLLNHSGSQTEEDVSGLSLSAVDVEDIKDFLKYGSAPSGLTADQIFASAQADAMSVNGALQFLTPSQITTNTATTTALQSLFTVGISNSQAISASTAVAGKTLLVFGAFSYGGTTYTNWFLNYYNANGNRYHMGATGGVQRAYQSAPQPYTTNGNLLTIVEPNDTLYQNYYYASPDYGFLSETSISGEQGKYFYINIQGALSLSDFVGKTVAMTNPMACTNSGKYEVSFGASLNQNGALPYTATCVDPSGTASQIDSGLVEAATFSTDGLPDGSFLKMIDASGDPHFLGLVSGSPAAGVIAEFSPINGYSGLEYAAIN